MTIIYDKGDFWIESFIEARSSRAAAAAINVNFNLQRPGRFVGGNCCLDTSLAAPQAAECNATITDVLNAELTYGEQIDQVRVRLTNNDPGPVILGVKCIVFLRK